MGANLITSLQQSARFPSISCVDVIQRRLMKAISNYGNDKWMPKLLRALKTSEGDTCAALSKQLGLKITPLPSDTTFRRVLDYRSIFKLWHSSSSNGLTAHLLSNLMSGWQQTAKVLEERSQNRERLTKTSVSFVSVYSHQQGVVLAGQQFEFT